MILLCKTPLIVLAIEIIYYYDYGKSNLPVDQSGKCLIVHFSVRNGKDNLFFLILFCYSCFVIMFISV